jgi:FdrA protein
MPSSYVIRKNQYYDSVFLMGVNKRLSQAQGVLQTAVLMGSEANKQLLADIGFGGEQIDAARPNDLIVAVTAESAQVVEHVLAGLDHALAALEENVLASHLHTLQDGLEARPQANLAVLSIPGEYVPRQATKALQAGLHLFIFSSNVPVEEERRLKQMAAEKGLLVMGPDCGTSIIRGVGIGFANVVKRGPFGAIGPSGTGLQEFTSQIDHAGYGISHAIGTGSRDLSDSIGGITTLQALQALENDSTTQVITIIAKPPGKSTLGRLLEKARTCRKPVIGCFLGTERADMAGADALTWAATIDEAVLAAIQRSEGQAPTAGLALTEEESRMATQARAQWSPRQRYLRGLFAGGTFCYQAQQVLGKAGLRARSNAPLEAKYKLADPDHSEGHTLIDMGDERYTLGKPHPMIDGTLRGQRIEREGRDPEMAVLLLDFILGWNASMDPVGEVLDAILKAGSAAREQGGELTIVASICGTAGDPQDYELQACMLREAGVLVFQSSARAALFCCELFKPG